MKNIRLYYPNSIAENSTVLISKEHTHYIVNVMRLKRGSNINFFNSNGEWLSEIVFLERDRVEVKFLNKVKNNFEKSKIELAICLIKKNPMELILEKATELGVSKITPIISERTEVKELNFERAKKAFGMCLSEADYKRARKDRRPASGQIFRLGGIPYHNNSGARGYNI